MQPQAAGLGATQFTFSIHQVYSKSTFMGRTPNDDRSDSMNPNNDAYHHAQDNHSDQLNPNNERYAGEMPDDETD